MPNNIPITLVRYDSETARSKLHSYLFEARYGASRAPRGVEPRLVVEYLAENLKPDSKPDVYMRVAELLRFYELPEALRTVRLALTGHESTANDALRSAYALQAIGDLGTAAEAAQGAEYFDRVLVQRAELTARVYPILFSTLVCLAPAGSPAALSKRLDGEVRKLAPAQRSSQQATFAYDELVEVQRGQAPKLIQTIEVKKQLLAAPPDPRRTEMVRIYLGISPRGGRLLGTWSARMLRKEAIEADPNPVYAEFGKAMDSLDEKKLGKGPADLIFLRAAQAIMYLHGRLTAPQRARFAEAGQPGDNFLWDDLNIKP